jgi:hypothetical protein
MKSRIKTTVKCVGELKLTIERVIRRMDYNIHNYVLKSQQRRNWKLNFYMFRVFEMYTAVW